MLLHFAACLAPLAQAPSDDFRAGDLVYLDISGDRLLLIDPVDGTVRDSGIPVENATTYLDDLCWDPFRARILFGDVTAGGVKLQAGASDGTVETLHTFAPTQGVYALAPTGDGRVYLQTRGGGETGRIALLSASGVFSFVDDAVTGLPYTGAVTARALEYHEPTNSLIAVTSFNQPQQCDPANPGISFWRYQLSADGLSVEGLVDCETFLGASTGESGIELARSLSRIDDESFLASIWAQDALDLPRLLRLRVDAEAPAGASLSVEVYSNTSLNNHAAATWSSTRGEAVVLEYFQDLVYAYAESDLIPDGVLMVGDTLDSAPDSSIVQITSAVRSGMTATGDGFISVAAGGEQQLTLDFPGAGGSLYYVAGSLSGFSPFVPLGGVSLPIAFDTYTTVGLNVVNSPPFVDFLGFLEGGSTSAPRFVVPAGTSAALVGLTAHHAAVAVDVFGGGAVTQASNAVAVTLEP